MTSGLPFAENNLSRRDQNPLTCYTRQTNSSFIPGTVSPNQRQSRYPPRESAYPGIYGTKAVRSARARSRSCTAPARVLSAGVLRPGVNLGHICTAHPRVVVGSWKARARIRLRERERNG
ncbi:hypothetical protein ALC57_12271 [Trachymyrmex cornetzi]|uniref:Uncharacterized protein n=1 Tax=Trachymyrmex cornetzi TaxID=471704 RepID=A0A151J125_9HYME|nr:hypothetical protein ALC57_12271 [Trachymyrmex cornetzi]